MLTAGAVLAIAYVLFVGCSICRALDGYDKAAEETSRDREWWRGLAEDPSDAPSPLADAAE